ncbi:Carbon-nitrogen hydrolase [Penicillium canariense]|uniref:Carbon-nitrogen hydrolase n=1 Tax=Penicillium canariense TaxID=189055 RepID=A0A9W9IM36_9EURO|nr:Carbon-nitrogen hydrolase [Penicillium canariense]KAJ5176741.1 Carbon-nitrogen hydrolase [Penicillium canariense]
MRIATLQFAPKLGDVEGNIQRANALLKKGKHTSLAGQDIGIGIGIDILRPDILVLPELALTGYNFPSLDAIRPYLEAAGTGPSASWARETAKRLRCKVCVGYPEIEHAHGTEPSRCYNSLLVVDETGAVIHNYRKSFLYFTDETWAAEGSVEQGFLKLLFPRAAPKADLTGERGRETEADLDPETETHPARQVPTSLGICMDINPYKFEAPYTAYEFANRALDSQSQLVILSMAWLTMLSRDDIAALDGNPDMDTFTYWLNRFMPFLEKKMLHSGDLDDVSGNGNPAGAGADGHGANARAIRRTVIVLANRAGEEPPADDTKPPARYAGTSAVIAVTQRPRRGGSGSRVGGEEEGEGAFEAKIACWDLLGAGEEGICFADTTADPKMVFGLQRKGKGSSDSSSEGSGGD